MRATGKTLFGMWLGILILNLALWAGIAWVTGSVVVSGIKVASNACGTTYQAEETVSLAGNMFCPSEK